MSYITFLTTDQIQGWTTADIAALTTSQIQELSSVQIVALTTDQVVALGTAQVKALTTAQVKALETADFEKLSTDQLGVLGSGQVAALTTAQVVALTTAQAAGLGTAQLRALTTAQVKALETADFQKLSTDQLGALSSGQVAALTTDQVVALTTEQAAGLGTVQLRALTTAQIKVLETADFNALSTTQLVALTTVQLGAITTAQVPGLSTADLAALTSAQVNAFSSAAIRAMTTDQINALTPIVLDLNGDGVSTLSVDQGVSFDLAASGTARRTGWVAPTDGLLVRDLNHDGVINDGRELFGSATRIDGGVAGDGFAALRALDSNQDGRLTAADAAFAELEVWKDANQNGVTDAGELSSLADNGVVALNLSAQASTATDNGNLLGLVSSFEKADGSSHEMVDVWFRQGDSGDALRDSVSELTQSLGSYLEAGADATAQAGLGSLPDASTGQTAQTMAVQLAAYYGQQPTLNPVAQGASTVSSLLSGGVGNAPATALLASSDSVKAK